MPASRRTKQRLVILSLVVALLAVAAFGVVIARRSINEGTLLRERELGMAAYEAQRYEEALPHLALYHGRFPDDAEAWIATADARRRVPTERGDHRAQALSLLKSVLTRDPDNLDALRMTLELEVQLGRRTEALETAQGVLAQEPDDLDALSVQATVRVTLGEDAAALEALERIEAAHGDRFSPRYFALDQRITLGSDPLELAATIEGQSTLEAVLRASMFIRGRDLANARAAMEGVDPTTLAAEPQLLDAALRMYDVLGMDSASRNAVDAVSGGDGQVTAVVVAAQRAWKSGAPTEALALLDTVRTGLAEAPPEQLGLAAFLEVAERGIDSAPLLETLRQRGSPEASAWSERVDALLALENGRAGEARRILRAILEAERTDALTWFLLADAERALGEERTAAEAYRRTTRLDPRWLSAHLQLTRTLLDLNELRDARESARVALSSFPREPRLLEAWLLSTVRLATAGELISEELDSAITFVEDLATRDPNSGDLLATIARLRIVRGDLRVAQTVVDRLDEEQRPVTGVTARALVTEMRGAGLEPPASLVSASDTGVTSQTPFERALAALEAGDEAAGREIMRQVAAEADNGMGPLWLAIYDGRAGASDAPASLAAVAESNSENAQIQLAVLREDAIWAQPELTAPVIGRLRELTGENATNWKLFEARRLLLTDRTEERAAFVATMLGPVLRRDEDNVTALLLMSDAMRLLGNDEDAVRMLARAVESAPTRPELLPAYIRALRESGRASDAAAALDQLAANTELSIRERRARAELMRSFGRQADALNDYRVLAETEGSSSDRLAYASLLSIAEPRSDEPLEIAEALIDDPEVGPSAASLAAGLLWSRGAFDRAEAIAARTEDPLALLATLEYNSGDFAAAVSRLEAAVAAGNDSASAQLGLVRARAGAGDFAGALEAARAGRAAQPDDETLTALAGVLEALERVPSESELHRAMRGMLRSAADTGVLPAMTIAAGANAEGLSDAQVQQLELAVRERPTSFALSALLASVLVDRGDVDGAAAVYRDAASASPADAAPTRELARLLFAAGRYDAAAVASEDWAERAGAARYDADVFHARAELQLGRHDAARALLEVHADEIARQADSNPAGAILLASARAATGDIEAAAAVLGDRPDSDPQWARILLELTSTLRDADTVRVWIERAAATLASVPSGEHDVAIISAWFDLARRSGAPEDLERVLEVAEAASTTTQETALYSAFAAEALDRQDDAETYYAKAIELGNANPVVLNNYAYLLLRHGSVRADEAARLAQRAVDNAGSLPPDARASFLDTLGVAQLATGDGAAAEAAFRGALALTPDAARLRVGIAESEFAQGRADAARATLSDIPADAELTDRARGRLDALRAQLGG